MINADFLKHIKGIQDLEISENFDMRKKSTLGLISVAKVFIRIKTEPALVSLIEVLNNFKMEYFVIGKGSNIVLPEHINCPVLQLSLDGFSDELDSIKNFYELPANTPINVMTGKAIKYGLKGWEVFTGIPATLGGAIWMNAGTSLGEIGRLIKSVKILRKNGEIVTYSITKNDFSYRKNNFLNEGDIIVSAVIYHEGVDKNIPKVIIDYLKKRSSTQPLTKRTCGCTFKNTAIYPDGETKSCIAGKIIDIIGLKGTNYKDLVVSLVHGNFIENHGEATQDDFLNFIENINSRIEKSYGYKLEMEAIVYRNDSCE